MITDAQYQAWLERDSRVRVVLCEAKYNGGTEYFANRGYVSGPTSTPANTAYDDLLFSVPEIRSAIDQSATLGDIQVLNAGGELDSWLDRAWVGREISLYFGDASWNRDDFRRIFQGIISEFVAPSSTIVSFGVADKAELLDVPASDSLYTGDAHPQKDKGKPRVYGDVFNVSPVLIDEATRKYQVSDQALTGISAVRAGGITAAYTAQLSSGTFTLNSAATGTITCDATATLTAADDIITDIVTSAGVLTASEIDSVTFQAFPTAPLGVYIQDTHERLISDALSEITGSLGAHWRFNRDGVLKIQQLPATLGSAVKSFVADDVRQQTLRLAANEQAAWRHIIGYRRNWTVQGGQEPERATRTRAAKPHLTIFGILTKQHGRAWAEAYRERFWRAWESRAELDTTVPDKERSEFEEDYLRVTAEDEEIKDTWPRAEDRDLDGTFMVSEDDAQAEADRRLVLRSTVRRVYSADMTTAPFAVDVGDVVSLDHPRYGFAGGVSALVIGITEQPHKGFLSLELWR